MRCLATVLMVLVIGFCLMPSNSVRAQSEEPPPLPSRANLPESPDAPAEVVHNENVIITGRLCVSSGCASGESFGTDSMKVKDNFPRLLFEDTGTSGDPTTDWRILINDAPGLSNNFFAVEDATAATVPFRIEGSAPSNTLHLDSTGLVGIGTSSPIADLHLVSAASPNFVLEQSAGGASLFRMATMRLNNDGLGIFLDVAQTASPIFIEHNAPHEALVVDQTGRIGAGTSAPDAALTVQRSDGSARLHVKESSGSAGERTLGLFSNKGALNLQLDNTDVNRQWLVGVRSGGDFRIQSNQAAAGVINFLMNLDGALTISGNLTVGSCSGCTAARAADDAQLSSDVLARLNELPIRRWRTRDAVEHLLPDMDAFHSLTGLGHPDGIAPLDVATVALAGLQDLQEENDALRDRLDRQQLHYEGRIGALESRLLALETALGEAGLPTPRSQEQIYLPSTAR